MDEPANRTAHRGCFQGVNMQTRNSLSEKEIERIRAEAEPKAMQVAKEAGVDWDSLPWNEKEARIVTQAKK